MIEQKQFDKWVDEEIGALGYYGLRADRELLDEQSDIYRDVRSIGYTKRTTELCRRCASVSITSNGKPIGPGTSLDDLDVVYTWSRDGFYSPLEIYLMLFPEKKTEIIEKIMKLTKCIVLMGPPGSGKGTVAEKIVGEFHLPHISTGDIVRAKMKDPDSKEGEEMKNYLGKGLLVPDEMVTDLFKEFLGQFPMRMFILDGFPRTVPQAEELKSILKKHSAGVACIISLNVPLEELKKRLDLRDRPDDKGVIDKRLDAYEKQTKPAIEWLKKNYSDKFHEINGNKTPSEVYQQVRALLSF